MKEIKNFNTFEVHRKIQVLGRVGWGGVGSGGSRKTNIYGGIRKKEGVMFFEGGGGRGGVDTPMYTMLRSRNAIITNFEGWL